MSKARDTADLNNGIDVDASGNVGIGTSSPSAPIQAKKSTTGIETILDLTAATGAYSRGPAIDFSVDFSGEYTVSQIASQNVTGGAGYGGILTFSTNGSSAGTLTEAMRIDSSGNLLVGQTTASSTDVGFFARQDGFGSFTRDGNRPLYLSRLTSDGEIVQFRKDSSSVGSIGSVSGNPYFVTAGGSNQCGISPTGGSDPRVIPVNGTGGALDNGADLGYSNARWDDIWATNGTIQTSDRNEKQDIEALSDAEQRVAVACKGLLRKFRWIDAVAEKGDDARIHFGIIAQDLQDAFAAEGLDAGRYAMFISSTWWETQTEVPAVEAVAAVYEGVVIPAVLDEDGNEVEPERTEQQLVTEAVEAKEAYTRTDTYETLEEAPEGATERTRLGVRYPELLAFIIGAM